MSATAFEQKLSTMESGLRTFIDTHVQKNKELDARMMQVEQAIVGRNSPGPGGGFGDFGNSLGDVIAQSEGFAALQKGAKSTGRIAVQNLLPDVKTILSGTWSAPPDYRPVMVTPPQPALPVRALMPTIMTQSNMIEFPKESTFTNNVGYQNPEGSDKGQSDATYTLVQLPVATLAHWLAASRQVLDDSAALSGYINGRLIYLLEQKVESEILFGSGSPHLQGICTVATPATSVGPLTLADAVGEAVGQLASIGVAADSVVLNPGDWQQARMSKAVGSGVYLLGDPAVATRPALWGLNVALAVSMPSGRFLVGDFATGAAVYDRQQNVLEISREHASFFAQNLVAILVETRMCVAVYSPIRFVYGLAAGGPVTGS